MKDFSTRVAVIGAGHAGIEAALATARMGIDTVLFTTNLDAVANLPCNPSIGGSAKGHLVFEIDALGGEMGYAADLATIQSRTLNLGKGAAVHSKRVQADRGEYKKIMKQTLEREKNLRLIQSEIVDIKTKTENEKKTENENRKVRLVFDAAPDIINIKGKTIIRFGKPAFRKPDKEE